MKPVIEVNHVWKEYQKGIDRRYKSLRDTIVGIPSRLFVEEKEKFWALEDIDIKVEAGESLGIIGRNGAGKSTLLKILSRITPPTKGEIILRGRVASLLEVGTGFHPELTGRENIFFNGSVLGMKYHEIKRKFDEIVDFSGVEGFIDTPLKHYSSGMQMRLAFSVAAHLDSEILLIDEVLAVGDSDFQKKCIGKMDDVSKADGKAILFVSHNMNLISQLCNYAFLLAKGKICEKGQSKELIQNYLKTFKSNDNYVLSEIIYNTDKVIKVEIFEAIEAKRIKKHVFYRSEDIGIRIVYIVYNNMSIIRYGINVNNTEGVNIFDSHFDNSNFYSTSHPNGKFESVLWIPRELLKTGEYFIGFGFFNHQINSVFARGKNILTISVQNDERTTLPIDTIPGIINPKVKWEQTSL